MAAEHPHTAQQPKVLEIAGMSANAVKALKIGDWNNGTGRRKSSVARVFIKKMARSRSRPRHSDLLRSPDLHHDRAPATVPDKPRFDIMVNRSRRCESAGRCDPPRYHPCALIDYDETLKGPEPGWPRVCDAREVERKRSVSVQHAVANSSASVNCFLLVDKSRHGASLAAFFRLLVQNASPTSPC
jgi:small subunit ribosomal protein S9